MISDTMQRMRILAAARNPLAATIQRAWARLGDESLGSTVKQGKRQIVRVTHSGRRTIVEPLSPWFDASDLESAIRFVEELR